MKTIIIERKKYENKCHPSEVNHSTIGYMKKISYKYRRELLNKLTKPAEGLLFEVQHGFYN